MFFYLFNFLPNNLIFYIFAYFVFTNIFIYILIKFLKFNRVSSFILQIVVFFSLTIFFTYFKWFIFPLMVYNLKLNISIMFSLPVLIGNIFNLNYMFALDNMPSQERNYDNLINNVYYAAKPDPIDTFTTKYDKIRDAIDIYGAEYHKGEIKIATLPEEVRKSLRYISLNPDATHINRGIYCHGLLSTNCTNCTKANYLMDYFNSREISYILKLHKTIIEPVLVSNIIEANNFDHRLKILTSYSEYAIKKVEVSD